MKTVSNLLLARSRDSGDRIFCTFKGVKTTFNDLLRGVQEMAGALASSGIRAGSRVGFLIPPSVEHIQLYLAVSWLGGCAIPFSIHLKSSGLEQQMRSSQPELMVASRVFFEPLQGAISSLTKSPTILWLEDGPEYRYDLCLDRRLRNASPIGEPVQRSLDDAIAISYTSGTTGPPKGVVMSERFYWIGAKNAGVLSEAHRDDIYFMWEPFYHVASWMTVMMALQHGLKIFMVDRFSASQLWEQIQEAEATKFHYLGGLINIILSQAPASAEINNSLSIAWGAACPTSSWRQFEDRFKVRVREGYGISEGQNFTHVNLDGVVGSMGRPVEEFTSWVVDESGRRCEPEQVGEIVLKPEVAGITMTGYFGEPQKTAQVLREDGCVYTGDLGYVDSRGNFFYRGRKKEAIRRRGENISAWEVERVINQSPGVDESAVLGVPSPLGEQDILAVIKMSDGVVPNALALVEFCSTLLAYYQVPRYIKFVSEFPRGPTQRIRKDEISTELESAWDAESHGFRPTRNI